MQGSPNPYLLAAYAGSLLTRMRCVRNSQMASFLSDRLVITARSKHIKPAADRCLLRMSSNVSAKCSQNVSRRILSSDRKKCKPEQQSCFLSPMGTWAIEPANLASSTCCKELHQRFLPPLSLRPRLRMYW